MASGDRQDPGLEAARRAQRAGDLAVALRELQAVLARQPARADLWVGLGELHHERGDEPQALAACAQALALAPTDPAARNLRALALAAGGDSAAAERELRALMADSPHHLPARANLASLLERSNRVADAERIARDGLRLAPQDPLLNLVVAQCLLRARDLDGCETFLARVEAQAAPGTLPQHAAFLRARLLDARGDAAAAFTAFGHAKARQLAAHQRQHPGPNRYLTQLAAELATCTPEWLASWRSLPAPAALPFRPAFLVGFPRSGTTLLDQILDAHPQLSTLEEQPFLEDLLNALPGGYPAGLAALEPSVCAALRARYAARVLGRLSQPGAVVVDKFPLNLTKAALLQRVFPEARFLLALRHPYDVVLSCLMQEFGMNEAMANLATLEDAARLYHAAFALWQRSRELLPLAVVEVRYERLLDDLPGEVAPALVHLGVAWDERVQGFAEHSRTRDRIRTPSYWQVSQGLYTSARGRFTKYLPQFSAEVRALLDPWVAQHGYPSVVG